MTNEFYLYDAKPVNEYQGGLVLRTRREPERGLASWGIRLIASGTKEACEAAKRLMETGDK